MMFAFLIGLGLLVPPSPIALPANVRGEVLRERVMSRLVLPGMPREWVEQLLGEPFGIDSYGPPNKFVVVYSYLFSGINVTFGADDKVIAVCR